MKDAGKHAKRSAKCFSSPMYEIFQAAPVSQFNPLTRSDLALGFFEKGRAITNDFDGNTRSG